MGKRIVKVAAIVLGAIGVAGVVAIVVLDRPPSASAHREVYNAAATKHQAATWAKVEPPTGQAWTPGSSKAQYRKLWEQTQGLMRTHDTLTGGSRPAEWEAVRANVDTSQPIPEACLALGVPADTRDNVGRMTTQEHCALIATWSPQIDALMAASRHAEHGAPFSMWDAWSVNPKAPGKPKSAKNLLPLVKMGLVRAYFQWLKTGDLDPYVDLALAAPFIGQDVRAGGDMVGVMYGVALSSIGLNRLTQLYLGGARVSRAQAQRVVDTLLAALRYPDTYVHDAAGAYLSTYGDLLPDGEGLTKPPAIVAGEMLDSIDAMPIHERIVGYWMLNDAIAQDGAIAQKLPATHAERLAFYADDAKKTQGDQDEEADLNPSTPQRASLRFPFERYDVTHAATHRHMCIVVLLYADRVAQHDGERVTSIASYPKAVVDACAKDPHTGEPVELVVEGDTRRLRTFWATPEAETRAHHEYAYWYETKLNPLSAAPPAPTAPVP